MPRNDWHQDRAEFVARPADAPHPEGNPDDSPLAQQFARLTEQLLRADTVADVLSYLASAALAVIPDADLVSVTLRSPDGQLHTPVETDPVAGELDKL